MKTVIYYFTGTGNSLAAARKIAGALGGCELVPIASLAKTPGAIAPEAERVGIVCPVYDCGLPVMIAGFADRLDLSRAKYTFAVVTMGGLGVSALHQLDRILRERQNRRLDAAFAVSMPGNFPPLMRSVPAGKCGKILDRADRRLDEIAEAIGSDRSISPGFAPLSRLVNALSYGSLAKSARDAGELSPYRTPAPAAAPARTSARRGISIWSTIVRYGPGGAKSVAPASTSARQRRSSSMCCSGPRAGDYGRPPK
ncbi:hypothetical protein DSECCO2_507850 [anaerobic digester metagenome]